MPANQIMTFIDSNCWLYLYLPDQDPPKRAHLLRLLESSSRPIVSTQVLAEIGANLCRKARVTENQHRAILDELTSQATIVPVTTPTLFRASYLRASGNWSYWDSIIIAAALEANCGEVWSEDLQHDRLVEGRLRIINPFRQASAR